GDGAAMAAGNQRFDGDPIADVDPPAARRPVTDALDDPERLVAGDERETDGQHAGVLLRVAATDAARLDPEERALVVDVGQGQLAQLERARPVLHHRPCRLRRHPPPNTRRTARLAMAVRPSGVAEHLRKIWCGRGVLGPDPSRRRWSRYCF